MRCLFVLKINEVKFLLFTYYFVLHLVTMSEMKFPEVLNGVQIFMLSRRIRLDEIVEKVKVCLCLV